MVCTSQAFQEVDAPRIGESWRRSGVCVWGASSFPWRLMTRGLAWPLPSSLSPQPFRCAHCHYSCNISGSLKRHYNRKHPNEEYSNVGTGELAADALIQQGRRAAAPLCLARPPGAALRPPSARPHVPGHHCSLPPPPCECQCYLRPGPYYSTLNGNLRASPAAQVVKNLPALWETWFQSLGQEDTLEKGMATYSNILAWRIPWTEEPGGL